jgi:hypothetical protein
MQSVRLSDPEGRFTQRASKSPDRFALLYWLANMEFFLQQTTLAEKS